MDIAVPLIEVRSLHGDLDRTIRFIGPKAKKIQMASLFFKIGVDLRTYGNGAPGDNMGPPVPLKIDPHHFCPSTL